MFSLASTNTGRQETKCISQNSKKGAVKVIAML
jgi:hypothetical protein